MSSLFSSKNLDVDSNYHPESLSFDSVDSSHKNQTQSKKVNEGPWSQQQCTKYIIFVHINTEIFSSKTKRKNLQIFKKLSEFLGTRTPRQCRSHFQKLKNRFGTVIKMRNHWKKQIGATIYEQQYSQIKQLISPEKFQSKESSGHEQKKFCDAQIQTDDLFCIQPHFMPYVHQEMSEQMEKWQRMQWMYNQMSLNLHTNAWLMAPKFH